MIACPLCGGLGMLPVTPHRRGKAWAPEQVAVVKRLRAAGLSAKATARLWPAVTESAVNGVERRQRERERGVA
jgi:hypothetical protein